MAWFQEVNTIAGESADVKKEKPIFDNENDGVADTAAKLEAERKETWTIRCQGKINKNTLS